jgi:hypothetical protein
VESGVEAAGGAEFLQVVRAPPSLGRAFRSKEDTARRGPRVPLYNPAHGDEQS